MSSTDRIWRLVRDAARRGLCRASCDATRSDRTGQTPVHTAEALQQKLRGGAISVRSTTKVRVHFKPQIDHFKPKPTRTWNWIRGRDSNTGQKAIFCSFDAKTTAWLHIEAGTAESPARQIVSPWRGGQKRNEKDQLISLLPLPALKPPLFTPPRQRQRPLFGAKMKRLPIEQPMSGWNSA